MNYKNLRFKYPSVKILNTMLILFYTNGYACISCNKELQSAIKESYYINTFAMFSAFIILTVLVLTLNYLVQKHLNRAKNNTEYELPAPLIYTAIILGIGLGGFADGIFLHQILQWHEMLSNKIAPDTVLNKSVNMFWDGIFHLFTLMTTTLGIYLLWKTQSNIKIVKSGYILLGGIIFGWGIFNLIEGIINHQILHLHNVREITTNKDLWNYGFLLFGTILVIIGILLLKEGRKKIDEIINEIC